MSNFSTRYGVLTAVLLRIQVLHHVILCLWVSDSWTAWPSLMKALRSVEISEKTRPNSQRYIPETEDWIK